MLLQIQHRTELSYSQLISESVVELRVAPRQEQYQHRLSFELAIGPPAQVSPYFDWLGNTVHAFSISGFHNQILIVANSVVEVERRMLDLLDTTNRWPPRAMNDYTLVDYLRFGGPVVDSPALRDLVAELRVKEGTPLGEIADRMLGLIYDRFEYEKGVTTVATPVTDVLEHRKGVCQDFTHVMIAMARALGIPARYVSGLVHSNHDHLRGSTETHAWCELLFPNHGWVGLDPTNRQQVGDSFITVAFGRDYRDVTPNRGVYRGSAKETMSVSVTSKELPAVPEELVGERYVGLPVPVYPGWSRERRYRSGDIQRAQQQQQQ